MHIARTAIPAGGAALAALIAGCGGSHNPSSTASSRPTSGIQAAYRFSACMRQHGVTNFPDPIVRSSAGHREVALKVTPALSGSPEFKSAQQACKGFLPAPMSPAQEAARVRYRIQHFVAFAACMRDRGITSFPDPNSQGDIPPALLAQAGINIHLPSVIAAARACVPSTGGLLSQAAITQATSGGGQSSSGAAGQSNGGG